MTPAKKILFWPPLDDLRLGQVRRAGGDSRIVNAQRPLDAANHIVDADGFVGKITPKLLASATRLTWVQSPTASLEHYVFPELVDHPLVLTNMRGGGEYGPAWHEAALKLNRHRAFEDFFAVAEALIADGVTTPAKLGAIGRSNGGSRNVCVMTGHAYRSVASATSACWKCRVNACAPACSKVRPCPATTVRAPASSDLRSRSRWPFFARSKINSWPVRCAR